MNEILIQVFAYKSLEPIMQHVDSTAAFPSTQQDLSAELISCAPSLHQWHQQTARALPALG